MPLKTCSIIRIRFSIFLISVLSQTSCVIFVQTIVENTHIAYFDKQFNELHQGCACASAEQETTHVYGNNNTDNSINASLNNSQVLLEYLLSFVCSKELYKRTNSRLKRFTCIRKCLNGLSLKTCFKTYIVLYFFIISLLLPQIYAITLY